MLAPAGIPVSTATAASAAEAAAFSPPCSIDEARQFTRRIALQHYENFPVVSKLLPRHLRQDFCNVYAFCRIADDLGDSMSDCATAAAALTRFRDATLASFAGEQTSALFVALRTTVQSHDIPAGPFLDLIDAFAQDQTVTRYDTLDQLLDYCTRSANPVGRLVLYMCGYRDEPRHLLSDKTCTALQLTNFWQDVRRDLLELDRIYLPAKLMRQFGVSEAQLRGGIADDGFRALLHSLVDRTEQLFEQGEALLPMLHRSVRSHIALFTTGGRAILRAIRRQNYDTLSRRPSLSTWQKGRLVAGALSARMRSAVRPQAGRREVNV